jgi:hypothetical protein
MSAPAACRVRAVLRRLSSGDDLRECCDAELPDDDEDDDELLELDERRRLFCDACCSFEWVECCVVAVCCELCDFVDLLSVRFFSSVFFFGSRMGDMVGWRGELRSYAERVKCERFLPVRLRPPRRRRRPCSSGVRDLRR